MSATVTLRDGRTAVIDNLVEGDAARILAYVNVVAGESDFLAFGRGEFGLTVEQEQAYLRPFSNPEHGVALKAEVDGEFVGTVSIARHHRTRLRHSGMLGISVLRAFSGVGLGRALMTAAIAQAKTIGIARVALHVREDNLRAIHLYESLGFRHEGRFVGGFMVGGIAYDDLALALLLPAGKSSTKT